MTILLPESRALAVAVRESHDPLVSLPAWLAPRPCRVRSAVATRLAAAEALLPEGTHLRVVEGHRSMRHHLVLISRRTSQVCRLQPGIGPAELDRRVAEVVPPVELSGHLSGSAVSVTLVDDHGIELDLGTALGASPEASAGQCRTDADTISPLARAHRVLLGAVLGQVGLVNRPEAWWHWSWGDRFWAACTGAPAAVHGVVAAPRPVAA